MTGWVWILGLVVGSRVVCRLIQLGWAAETRLNLWAMCRTLCTQQCFRLLRLAASSSFLCRPFKRVCVRALFSLPGYWLLLLLLLLLQCFVELAPANRDFTLGGLVFFTPLPDNGKLGASGANQKAKHKQWGKGFSFSEEHFKHFCKLLFLLEMNWIFKFCLARLFFETCSAFDRAARLRMAFPTERS